MDQCLVPPRGRIITKATPDAYFLEVTQLRVDIGF